MGARGCRFLEQLQSREPTGPEPAHLGLSLPEEVRNSGRDVLCKHRKPSKHGISSNGSEEASDPLESNASQTEPNAFLFLLPTLVWHPQLTDGYFPAFQNNGSSQKGSTSSLASPVPDLHKQADACK